MEDTPGTPSSAKKKLDYAATPSPKRTKLDETICSVMNITEMMRTPSKFNPNKWYDRFEFGVATNKSDKILKVHCYKPEFREFLINSNIVGDDKRAIQIYGLLPGETDGHLKLLRESTFGELVDLVEPFELSHQPIIPIANCHVKIEIGCMVSIEAKVISYEVSHNKKCSIHKYDLHNNKSQIDMFAYSKLDLKVGSSYQFLEYEVTEFQNIRQLKHTVSSRYKEVDDVVAEEKDVTVQVSVRSFKTVESITKCQECEEVVDKENIDDDGLYTCSNEKCGVTGIMNFFAF